MNRFDRFRQRSVVRFVSGRGRARAGWLTAGGALRSGAPGNPYIGTGWDRPCRHGGPVRRPSRKMIEQVLRQTEVCPSPPQPSRKRGEGAWAVHRE